MDLAAVAPLIPRWKLWSPISSSGAGDAARCARSRHGFSSARRSAFDGSGRGEKVYADLCAKCQKDDGLGEHNKPPRPGYSIPPLRGDDSFNAATIVYDSFNVAVGMETCPCRGLYPRQHALRGSCGTERSASTT